jgi:putative photosynthetic complex assembly protein
MSHTHHNLVPPAALKAAMLLVLISLALVASVTAGLIPASTPAAELRRAARITPATERMLHFTDKPDGTVHVTDARSGAVAAVIGREGGGFIRGVLRGLARERRQHGSGAATPFRLTAWANGALSLADPVTGRVVELDGFGPTNRAAFARLLGERGA